MLVQATMPVQAHFSDRGLYYQKEENGKTGIKRYAHINGCRFRVESMKRAYDLALNDKVKC